MTYNIKYQTRLVDFNNPVMEQEVHDTLDYNVQGKMESFWKKHLSHPDAEALIKTDIKKDAKGDTYTGKIEVYIPGHESFIHESSYHNVIDFVNNSFKHFKEELARS